MKKVLIIVYYWPPGGGAGVQRWLKFVKYLPQFGWMPAVVTTKDGDYPAIDESLLDEIPDKIKVIRTKTPSFGQFFRTFAGKNEDVPYGSLEIKKSDNFLKKLLILFRINFIVPDARKLWNKYALKAAGKELLSNKYEAVITSGPPHSTHLIGLKLKKKFNINWIADFRDPWTKIDYLDRIKRLFITKFLDRKLEKSVVRGCDGIITISRKIAEDLNAGDKTDVVPNGFDPADFKDMKKNNSKDHFNIDYFGNITIERDPSSILKAVYMLRGKGITNIRMNFRGNVSSEVRSKINELDKNSIVNIQSYIPHNEMLKEMVNSSLLLLVINNVLDNRGILTGKIYEYLTAKVPVLGLGPKNGEAANILQETETGKMFDYENIEEITDFIKEKYENWQVGKTFP
ncbi:MAG: glycosyltransferase family 4 protein, partial [Candidatus Cloacimonetes bacterium]|nr:glycosyltransferase family 4 protein [Candidatus Cloacimonadota bacterium]